MSLICKETLPLYLPHVTKLQEADYEIVDLISWELPYLTELFLPEDDLSIEREEPLAKNTQTTTKKRSASPELATPSKRAKRAGTPVIELTTSASIEDDNLKKRNDSRKRQFTEVYKRAETMLAESGVGYRKQVRTRTV